MPSFDGVRSLTQSLREAAADRLGAGDEKPSAERSSERSSGSVGGRVRGLGSSDAARGLRERLTSTRTAMGERSRATQRTAGGRRLRQALGRSTLDPLEQVIVRYVIEGPDRAGVVGDFQLPVATSDLIEALEESFSAREISATVASLADRRLLLNHDGELYLTPEGLVSLRGTRPAWAQRVAAWRANAPWVVDDENQRVQTNASLLAARKELAALRALEPPERQRDRLDEAIAAIDEVAASIK